MWDIESGFHDCCLERSAERLAMVKVFLVDDHEVVRRGLADLLAADPDLEVIGDAGSVSEAMVRIPAAKPDVAVLDVRLPDGNGIELCRDLLSELPELRCLMLTSFTSDEAMLEAILREAGWRVGLMTCYDVRFPETARLLVDAGAQVLALPAAWVRGPAKERHWEVMVTARALENTCYVAASGECGRRNIGASMVVDPLGTVRDRLADRPGLLWAVADREELDEARRRLPVLANRRFRVDPSIRPRKETA